MSATTPGSDFDHREQLARIDRNQAEIAKLFDEASKLRAEAPKLTAEAAKFQRETTVAPWLAGGAVAGGILTGATLLLRALGVLS